MPYTLKERRARCESYELMPPENAADLCYILCRLMTRYTEYKGLSFDTIGDIRNALFGCYDEYRKVIIEPYEHVKGLQNGPDIWGTLPDHITGMYDDTLDAALERSGYDPA